MNPLSGMRPSYICLSCFPILTFIICVFFPPTIARSLVNDTGLIQILTTVLLAGGVAIALAHVIFRTPSVSKWIEMTCIMLFYLMREMDFHRIFTTVHVTRIELYTGPNPLSEKIIGGAIMLAAFGVAAHFTITNMPVFWKKLKAKEPLAFNIMTWGIVLFLSQVFNKPKLCPKGPLRHVLEENMELSAALLIVFILSSFPFRKNKRQV